jgi:hypothetical protein
MRLTVLFLFFSAKIFAQNIENPKLEFVCELKVTTDKTLIVGKKNYSNNRRHF